MINLNTQELIKIGQQMTTMLGEVGITETSELIIKLDPYSLLKIDEDLYYRQNPQGKDYKPTEQDVVVKFPLLNIKLQKR
jgi:hypothetical protein